MIRSGEAVRRVVRYLLIAAAIVFVAGSAWAQGEGRYYPETGHTLDGTFVSYYDEHGGLRVLGYPITDSFVDPGSGFLIQYLQNNRVELIHGKDGSYVKMPVLGELLGGWEPPLQGGQFLLGSMPGCRYYPEAGHRVCHAFLEFYENYGGPAVFGYPISEFKLENGRLVQYFQGFRLDWHPEAPAGEQVRVGQLGRVHFELSGYDRSLLKPRQPNSMQYYRVVELRPTSATWKPMVQSTDTQKVYLVVRDQNLNPLEGASVTLVAKFADHERMLVMPQSDQNGVSMLTLSFENQPPGANVVLEFWVVYGELVATTQDSFRVWW